MAIKSQVRIKQVYLMSGGHERVTIPYVELR